MNFSYHKATLNYAPTFSILIPSWNNLPYLKCAIDSIKKNSTFQHQIIVHINEGLDGTEEWVRQQPGVSFSKSETNCGVCYGFNAASHLALSEHLVFIDDDMYLCPDWDRYLVEEISAHQDDKWCISSTMIEPFDKGNPCVITNKPFGLHPDEFEEERFLSEFASFEKSDWNGSQWYPMVLPTAVYRAVGGLSIEFTPGMYSDPDFMIKLWHYGVRYFKGLGKSRAYHFGSRTTARVKRNDGRSTFILKWGMSSNTFFQYYLQIGPQFLGKLPDTNESAALDWKKRIDRWKVKLLKRFIPLP
jgi:glycosyltransferase involved in cell wall biosynthesis